MDTKWMWKAKSSETILSVKTQQRIRLEKEFLCQKRAMHFCVGQEMLFFLCWQSLYFSH